MSSRSSALIYEERPVFFDAAGAQLFGMLTLPSRIAPGSPAVVMLPGGAWMPGSHRGSFFATMARRLAGLGVPTLRVDYHGVGESSGHVSHYNIRDLFVDDVVGATGVLRELGFEDVMLVATCFGARTALAAGSLSSVRAMALLAPPLLDYSVEEGLRESSVATHVRKGLRFSVLRGLANPRNRRAYAKVIRAKLDNLRQRGADSTVSRGFLRDLSAVAERDVPVLLAYGEDDEYYTDLVRARDGRLGRLIAQAAGRIEVATCPGRLHGFAWFPAQEFAIDTVCTWIGRIVEPVGVPNVDPVDAADHGLPTPPG